MVNFPPKTLHFLWTLAPCAVVLTLAAWLRGAEYDEQYTLFLTAGTPRPIWPAMVFPAGLVRQLQTGNASFAAIAHDLRVTDVHPPLYFWLVSLWRAAIGHGLIAARMLSVVLGLGALTLTGTIARLARLPPARAMLLTLGCYGFTYTSIVARGFVLAHVLLLAGVTGLLIGRRSWHFVLAGASLGAATMTNYLAVFVAGACLLALGVECVMSHDDGGARRFTPRRAIAAAFGFLMFIPGDLWWFLAQSGTRSDQFPSFSLLGSLARLIARFAGDLLGGLPLYVDGPTSAALAAMLGSLLLWLLFRVIWRWRQIGTKEARILFAFAAAAPPCGLLVLGFVFNTTPIEIRYLSFSTPFIGLLLAGALGIRGTAVLLAVQAAAIAGLMLAPKTMQPGRAAAQTAAALVRDGVVLLPRGNDGVGVVGAFAIESPPALPLVLVSANDTTERILDRIEKWHRVVLAMLEQDASSRAASEAMRRALATPNWKEVAHGPNVAVYERVGAWE